MNDIKGRLSEKPPRLPDWLHVDTMAVEDIIKAYDYWSTLKDSKNTPEMLGLHTHNAVGFDANSSTVPPEAMAAISSMTEPYMRQIGLIHSGETLAHVRNDLPLRLMWILNQSEANENMAFSMDKEQQWYSVTKAFIPPPELWNRHPGFSEFRQFNQGNNVQFTRPEKNAVS